jgi:hypothetical protein
MVAVLISLSIVRGKPSKRIECLVFIYLYSRGVLKGELANVLITDFESAVKLLDYP